MSDELAKRAVAVFKWAPGMRGQGSIYWKKTTAPYRGRIDVMEGRPCVIVRRILARGTCEAIFFAEDPVPDIADPATIGCMLAQVREAWGNERMHPAWTDEHVIHEDGGCTGEWYMEYSLVDDNSYDTEAEAIIAAMEALPPACPEPRGDR